MAKLKKMVLLTGNCTDKKCKKRSTTAFKTGDFWIEQCDDHQHQTIAIDFDKIGLYIDPPEVTNAKT